MDNTVQEVEEMIEVRFTKNSHSWHDYERAKQVVKEGFTSDEYTLLIKFIANYLGV